MTRIDCHQIAPHIGDRKANQDLALEAISSSAAAGADIIVLPELVTSGYMFTSPEETRSLAMRVDDVAFDQWAAASDGAALVVGGFPELGEDGNVYNSAAILNGSGIIAIYRKVHLWDREKLVFTPGPEVPPIIDTPVGRIGVLICYDLEFPEMPRGLALGGADLIVVPTNWPYEERPDGEISPTVTIARGAARVSRVPIACCDRSGTERGQDWNQGTSIIDREGWIVTSTGTPGGVASAELDLTLSRDKKETDLADAFADRRPQIYSLMHESTSSGPYRRVLHHQLTP